MRTTLTNAISITGILLCLLLTTDRLVAADAQSELGVDDRSATLLDDRFDTLDPGQFSSIVGAHTEYHYLKDVAPKGHWSVTSFRSDIGSQRAWKVFRIEDDAVLAQTFDNKKTRHAHPMVIAGDDAWGDYTLTVRFAPQFDRAQSGVVFRYRNDRCYYWFGIRNGQAVLKLVKHATAFRKPHEVVLASAPYELTGDSPEWHCRVL